MTVFEMIGQLSSCDPNAEVKIIVVNIDAVGATPSVGVDHRGINNGFDWDSGRVLIRADTEIMKVPKSK